MLDGEKAPLLKETSVFMLAKILLWAVATFLAALFFFLAERSADVTVGGIGIDGFGFSFVLSIAGIMVAFWAGISAFAGLALPWFVKYLVYLAVVVLTLILVGAIKDRLTL